MPSTALRSILLIAGLLAGATALARQPLTSPVYYLITAPQLVDGAAIAGELTLDSGQNFKDGSRLDVFVLPSRREALGVAVLEGMAAGLPIVATRVGGIPEMVRPGVEGYLVEPGSAQELAAALRRVLDDPQGRMVMGAAGVRRAREFSVETMTRVIREIYLQASSGTT